LKSPPVVTIEIVASAQASAAQAPRLAADIV